MTLESTIVADNTAPDGPDLSRASGTVNANRSLIESPQAGAINGTNTDNIIGQDPLLGPLQNNGGPTPTHALLAGSPAIDKGSNLASLSFDQRGPGFARVKGAAADIGAFEADPAAADTLPAPVLSTPRSGGTAMLLHPFVGRAGKRRLVARGDVTGDGVADLFLVRRRRGRAEVRVIDGATGREIPSLFGFSRGLRGGVLAAGLDLDGDGRVDFVQGLAPRPGR